MDGLQTEGESKPAITLGQPEIKTPMAVPKRDPKGMVNRWLNRLGIGLALFGVGQQAVTPGTPLNEEISSKGAAISHTLERVRHGGATPNTEQTGQAIRTQVEGQRKNEQIVIPGNSNAAGTLTDNPPIRKY